MPIVRIDLLEGKTPEYGVQVGLIVARALTEVLNVPKDTCFRSSRRTPQPACGLIGIILASTDQTTAYFCRSH